MRSSRSHESLLTSPSSMSGIALTGGHNESGDVEIKPLHSSLLGQEHCFQVSTAHGTKFYSCRSAEEREKWIQHLRKAVQPKQEMTQRTDNSIKLWVLEAKRCPAKKRYFCELCLDETLYSRTSSKTKGDLLFWGEHFDFNNVPPTQKVTVNLYREADKKKKKERNVLIGYVHIPVSEISKRHLVEKWYTVSAPVVGKAGKENKTELPQIRIKARYQTVKILPLEQYKDLIEYIERDYSILAEVLEPVISVKAKEELATCLVNVLHKNGHCKDFLTDIVMAEVDKLENDNLAFRGNSLATKSMEAFLKLVGERYLRDTLGDFIRTILDATDECEVDPAKVPPGALTRQQTNLIMYCQMAWFKMINSQCFFPNELKEVFGSMREACEERKRPEVADNLISACIFLRFLCPAILSPSLFNLSQEFPQEKAARNLTLIAKVVQSLANFTKFGAKEEFMSFLNEFVEGEMSSMKNFLQQISKVEPKDDRTLEFDGYIDLGRELSVLHTVLVESLTQVTDSTNCKLRGLVDILQGITDALEQPSPSLSTHSSVNGVSGGAGDSNQPSTSHNNGNFGGIVSNLLKDYGETSSLTSVSLTSSVNAGYSTKNRSGSIGGGGMRGFDNPHRNGSVSSMVSSSVEQDEVIMITAPASSQREDVMKNGGSLNGLNGNTMSSNTSQQQFQQTKTQQLNQHHIHQTEDYVLYTSVEPSLPDHLQDDRLAASQSTPSMKRPDEKIINQSWERMLNAAEMVNGGEYVDLIAFMDQSGNSSAEIDFGGNSGDQMSVGQLSNVASSGYQSFAGGYSQSSSPIDVSEGLTTTTSQTQPLSFANPLFGHMNSSSAGSPLSSGSNSRTTKQKQKPRQRSPSTSSLSDSDSLRRQQQRQQQQQLQFTRQKPPLRNLSSSSSNSSSESLPRSQLANSSPHLPRSSPPMCSKTSLRRVSELSRSVELRPPLSNGSPIGMKRTVTDTGISKNCAPSTYDTSVYGSFKGNGVSGKGGNSVRMGVRSVQRKLKEQEKTKSEYEQELNDLRQKLGETQNALSETQTRLETRAQSEDPTRTYDNNTVQETEKDAQIQEILSRSLSKLVTAEEKLRQEELKHNQELPVVLGEKQRIIDQQEQTINSLNDANNRLLEALNDLKERYHHKVASAQSSSSSYSSSSQNMVVNGRVLPPNGSSSPVGGKLGALDRNGQHRSSDC